MRLLNRPADRFQHALEGQPPSDAEIADLLSTSRHLVELRGAGPPPDAAFVAQLRERLVVEAASLPAPSRATARGAASRRGEARSTPVVVVVGRGLPRLLAGAVATALVVGGLVGIASRSTLPGDALYPVKGWLDSVAVRMADSDLDRGRTQLAQAQEHISDARDLAGHRQPDAGDVNVAVGAAVDSVRAGQRSLDAAWTDTGNPQALLAQRDFAARALPQVEALRTEAPADSLRLVGQLEALLQDTQSATLRRLAACGSACSGAASQAVDDLTVPSTALTAGASGSATPSPRTTSGGITVPGSAVTNPAGGGTVPAPGATAGTGGVTIGGSGTGATLSTDGATLNPPTVSASVPGVPSGSVSLPLPSATLGTGGATATQPPIGAGPVTVSLPPVTLSGPKVP
jgi:hypothetical protein